MHNESHAVDRSSRRFRKSRLGSRRLFHFLRLLSRLTSTHLIRPSGADLFHNFITNHTHHATASRPNQTCSPFDAGRI